MYHSYTLILKQFFIVYILLSPEESLPFLPLTRQPEPEVVLLPPLSLALDFAKTELSPTQDIINRLSTAHPNPTVVAAFFC
mgnify:CR=1 FL=1